MRERCALTVRKKLADEGARRRVGVGNEREEAPKGPVQEGRVDRVCRMPRNRWGNATIRAAAPQQCGIRAASSSPPLLPPFPQVLPLPLLLTLLSLLHARRADRRA